MQYNELNPNKHATYHSFFFKHFVLLSIFLLTHMPLAYISTLCFSFFLLRPSALFSFFLFLLLFLGLWPPLFSSFSLKGSRPLLFFPNVACFHNIQSIQFKGDMQLYVIDTYSHIGQGGMKKNEWPKGVESKDI